MLLLIIRFIYSLKPLTPYYTLSYHAENINSRPVMYTRSKLLNGRVSDTLDGHLDQPLISC